MKERKVSENSGRKQLLCVCVVTNNFLADADTQQF